MSPGDRRRRPERLVLATQNPGKFIEMKSGLAGLAGVRLLSLADFPEAPDVEETGTTYRENAALKAVSACRHTGLASLGDDTGLEVDALDGAPGLFSARFAGGAGHDAAANRARLLEALEGVPEADRSARFRCVLALAEPGEAVLYIDGTVEGRILKTPRGDGGFGYDPLFLVAGRTETMAEMSLDEKNTLSHRGRALRALSIRLAERG